MKIVSLNLTEVLNGILKETTITCENENTFPVPNNFKSSLLGNYFKCKGKYLQLNFNECMYKPNRISFKEKSFYSLLLLALPDYDKL